MYKYVGSLITTGLFVMTLPMVAFGAGIVVGGGGGITSDAQTTLSLTVAGLIRISNLPSDLNFGQFSANWTSSAQAPGDVCVYTNVENSTYSLTITDTNANIGEPLHLHGQNFFADIPYTFSYSDNNVNADPALNSQDNPTLVNSGDTATGLVPQGSDIACTNVNLYNGFTFFVPIGGIRGKIADTYTDQVTLTVSLE